MPYDHPTQVWRLSIAGEGTAGVVPGAWTMVPTTFATNPFNPFGTYRPPMIGHSATVDGDGNMLVRGSPAPSVNAPMRSRALSCPSEPSRALLMALVRQQCP